MHVDFYNFFVEIFIKRFYVAGIASVSPYTELYCEKQSL